MCMYIYLLIFQLCVYLCLQEYVSCVLFVFIDYISKLLLYCNVLLCPCMECLCLYVGYCERVIIALLLTNQYCLCRTPSDIGIMSDFSHRWKEGKIQKEIKTYCCCYCPTIEVWYWWKGCGGYPSQIRKCLGNGICFSFMATILTGTLY